MAPFATAITNLHSEHSYFMASPVDQKPHHGGREEPEERDFESAAHTNSTSMSKNAFIRFHRSR